MRTRILTTIIVFVFASGIASGATGKDFCESFVTLSSETRESNIPFTTSWKIILRPKKIIKASYLGEEAHEQQSLSSFSEKSKYIFVHLPVPLVDFKSLEKLKKHEDEIADLRIISELRVVKSVASCLEVINNNPKDFELMSEYIEEYNKNLDNLNAKKEAQSTLLLLRKLKRFAKKGWNIIQSPDLFDMYQMIEKTKSIREIMLVSHSDELGRIYDAKKNIFPKGAFSNLPENIKKVIMYSCHSRQVLEYYEINKLSAKIDYYFPEIQEEFKEVYSTKIPVVAVRGMLEVAKAGTRTNLSSYRQCSVLIDYPEAKNNVVISLNDQFVGTLSNTTQIDCGLINENKNIIKVFYIGSVKRDPLQISAIRIITKSKTNLVGTTKEFLSKNRNNHLLTIGTFGGTL